MTSSGAKRKTRILFAFVLISLIASSVYIFVTRIAYDAMSLTGTLLPELLPTTPFEEVSFSSRGRDYPVYAFWQTTTTDAPVIINIHGYRNSRYNNFILSRANMLVELGYNVLSPDLSDSGGKTVEDGRISMGFDESYDVLGAYDYLLTQGFKPEQIGLVGESLGGATSLYVGQLQPEIKVIWADSPYSDAPMVLREQASVIGFPSFIVNGGLIWARLLSQDDIAAVSPITAGADFAANNQSVYLATCEIDQNVNPHHAKDLYATYSAQGVDVTFWEIPCTDHATGMLYVPDEYRQRLGNFLQKLVPNS